MSLFQSLQSWFAEPRPEATASVGQPAPTPVEVPAETAPAPKPLPKTESNIERVRRPSRYSGTIAPPGVLPTRTERF